MKNLQPAIYTLFLLLHFSQPLSLYGQSVLASGDWFKIKIPADGIYKITAQQLRSAGLDLNTINPRNIALYGNPGGMLPQPNAAARPTDLAEMSITVRGEEDGRFDNDDFILFFAQGAHETRFLSAEGNFRAIKNIYSDFNYCFLTIKNSPGKRIAIAEQPAGGQEFDYFDEHFHHEKDEFNVLAEGIRNAPGGSGRDWYGEYYDVRTTHDFEFEASGMNAKKDLRISVMSLAFSTGITNFSFRIGDKNIGTQAIAASFDNIYSRKGNTLLSNFRTNANDIPKGEKFKLTASYTKNEPRSFGATDFVSVNYTRDLRLFGNATRFRLAETAAFREARFVISDIRSPEQTRIWDVTDYNDTRAYVPSVSGDKARFGFNTDGKIREFIVFSGDNFPQAEITGKIPNQNIKGQGVPNFIIISHKEFLSEARRLAEFRSKNDGLKILVLDIEQVYNEFSSGRLDVTAIRDCIRYFYLRNPAEMKYALLFGDASFDYRGRMALKSDFVPIYQSRESLHPIFSFSSEDYFGMMDINEGEWLENNSGETDTEVAVGRIPARSLANARDVVNKIIRYAQTDALGEWRKKICLVADDGDRNMFAEDSEKLANYIDSAFSAINVRKVYIDAFPQVSTENGKRAFQAQERLNHYAENGALIVNFMGHGSETVWTQENVLDVQSILAWQNANRLPFFFTGTCEFGRYDNPYKISGGEWIITSPNAGIGLLTTTRPVFAETNFTLAKNFYKNLFTRTNGAFLRIGDIFRLTKNSSLNLANRNFSLLGDPTMRLAYPQDDIEITSITDNGQSTAQLKALSRIEVTAEVRSGGRLIADFNGNADVTVFEKPAEITTYGDESSPMTFKSFENVIYKGIVPVRNGRIQFRFVVPKDINYRADAGRISIYAYDSDKNRDAVGAKPVNIGGSVSNAPQDNQPPQIRLFIDNESFTSGQTVPSNTQMIAYLSDENGINITGIGIGREITAELTGAKNQTFSLNELYRTIDGDFTKGKIILPLTNLPAGKYTLKLSAWDTYNNLGTASVEFSTEQKPVALSEISFYPNPFGASETGNLKFSHDRQGDKLEFTVLMLDNLGRAVRKQTETFASAPAEVNLEIPAANNDNQKLPKGLYIVRVSAKSLTDGSTGTAFVKVMVE